MCISYRWEIKVIRSTQRNKRSSDPLVLDVSIFSVTLYLMQLKQPSTKDMIFHSLLCEQKIVLEQRCLCCSHSRSLIWYHQNQKAPILGNKMDVVKEADPQMDLASCFPFGQHSATIKTLTRSTFPSSFQCLA